MSTIYNKIIPLLLLLFIIVSPRFAHAIPSLTLSAQATNNFHSVIFDFIQNDLPSMEGCHYNLFAAGKKSDLKTVPNGKSIATFYKPLPLVQIIASPIKHVARSFGKKDPQIKRSVKVYFRVLLSCPEATNGMSNLISVSLKTFPDGKLKTVHEITKQMKHHMAYYNP